MKGKRSELHVVRTDVLLFALGGFGEELQRDSRTRLYSDYQIAVIRKFLTEFPTRTPYYELRKLSEKVNVSRKSLMSQICRYRKRGLPQYWRAAA